MKNYKLVFASILFIVATIWVYKTVKTQYTFCVTKPLEITNVEEKIEKLNPRIDDDTKLKVAYAITDHSAKYKIPINTLLAIASVESGFNPIAICKNTNGTKDRGITGINEFWNGKLGIEQNKLSNIYYSFESTCKIITHLRENGYSDISYYHSLNSNLRAIYKDKIKNVFCKLEKKDE